VVKRKLERFAEIENFENVFQHIQNDKTISDFSLKGRWNEHFANSNPIVVELGCGKGEYTLGLAQNNPSKNFIGVDLKGNRIWRGAKTALETNLKNVAFFRTRIENIEYAFAPGEVSEIWITFPDPQPQLSRQKKRLTSNRFINKYKNILKPGGIIHLKTDNAGLYEYTLEVIKENGYKLLDSTSDLYSEQEKKNRDPELKSIQTFYEKKFSELGFKICYLKFKIS